MRKLDIFRSADRRSIDDRKRRLAESSGENSNSGDFEEFGYDYFDNEDMPYGYAGYHYDGRYKKTIPAFCREFDLKPGGDILEIGCAKGYLLFEFFTSGFNVTGVDASKYAASCAKEEIKDKIQISSSPDLPFRNDSFDLVIAKEVVPHLEENAALALIKDCMRVARGSGIFLEIQCAEDAESGALMKAWDRTHKTIKSSHWWETQLKTLDFNGAYHCKKLF